MANKDVGVEILRVAINNGFLEFDDGVYRIATALGQSPKCCHMPYKQREVLLKLMEAFPNEKFTVRNATELTGQKYSTVGYYLDTFTQRGILTMTKTPQNVNYYELSSEVHGIFEAIEPETDPARFQKMMDREKEIHDPLRTMAEVG